MLVRHICRSAEEREVEPAQQTRAVARVGERSYWKAVLTKLQQRSGRRQVPYVHRCLCYPHETGIDARVEHHIGADPTSVLKRSEIEHFATWWKKRPKRDRRERQRADAKQLFCEVFASSILPKAKQHFLDETDRILERHTALEFRLLDQLQENPQLLIRGGTGSGKTSLAIEQAHRWSAQGLRVLFLCYNLPLEDQLARLIERRKPANGSVAVRSFERLGMELCPSVKQPFITGASAEERKKSDLQYYEETLPQAMRADVSSPEFARSFDALVVDEAQDHNTVGEGLTRPGWWDIYVPLLKQRWQSPMCVFYDPAQRLPWRTGSFEIADLENFLLSPVRVRLTRAALHTKHPQLSGDVGGSRNAATGRGD